ncbi:type II-A CRISPR-associated protein Csn2 [Lactobacillaceae bacterium Melli_B4]
MIVSYITHYKWKLKPGEILILGTDNPVVYRDLTVGLSYENENVNILNDLYDSLKTSHVINWIGDLTNYQISRPIENAVRTIASNLNETQINQLHAATNQLFTIVQDCLFMTNLPLQVNNDGDLLKIFKYCNIDLEKSISNNPYAIIEALVNMQIETGDDKVIGLTNVAHYLDADQIEELSLLCKDTGITLISVEFTTLASQYRYRSCNFYHIDEDFVDWHPKRP